MRLVIVILVLTVVFTAPLLIFGETFDVAFSGEEAIKRLKEYGPWIWAVGMGLIVADLALPIPATAVMAAMGYFYGAILGGVIGATASILAGWIAYGATRMLGRRAALKIVGERDLASAESFFQRRGGFAVAISRPLPLLPEVVACLAGLSGMPARKFTAALICGSLPTGMAYAAIGALGIDRPSMALAAGCILPVILWAIVQTSIFRTRTPDDLSVQADDSTSGVS